MAVILKLIKRGGYAPKAPQQPAPADLDDDLPF